MLHLAEETKVFHFLSCMKFHSSSFSVCIKTDFEGQFIVSDMSKTLSFPHKFSYQNVDYVKLTNIQI